MRRIYRFYPILFITLTVFAFFLNLLGLMKLIPLFITLPLFFLSIYVTLHSLTQRNVYRRFR
ncbi:hypothetical protein [Oceanobacillus profundus]|uniref:Uncharacterized protein n=1 Tax=Oceanobacillus profundus TaxID=372463 RepID=A0A417YLS1_9BACI|nr:hypothetical protein [Oceanobacillus profundus]MCM3399209.1 hypothetical protein [Oceanobacillus profundus]MDO6449241.1 hypothetical protein [Oceanobacillus profundus]PAE29644.1 hypothetical protein CHI07_08505 [Paenibacillus sp. 7884-2]RHW34446.1 hypothetical protein D1B32_04580 [Oceanobacillus profundus]